MRAKFQIAAVIFDMDGLIVDSELIYKQTWQTACKEYGFNLSDEEHNQLKGRGRKAALLEVQKNAALQSVILDLEKFAATLIKFENQFFNSEPLQTKRGFYELLDFLEEIKIPKAVATSTSHSAAKRTLESLGVFERFHAIVGGDEVSRGKPSPDIFEEAQSRLGVDSKDCLVLEDSEHGVQGAKAAGMYAVRIPDGITKDQIEFSKADLILDSLTEVLSIIQPKY